MSVQFLTHDDDGMVYACPSCNLGGYLRIRVGHNTHAGDPDAPYCCNKCGETCYEPVERERESSGGKPEPFDLEGMDPEDLGLSPIGER